tara:strand:- start:315 stop:956 length:642 start_codon:yes stop_codon:yes gene_type:complete
MKFVPNNYNLRVKPNSLWLAYDLDSKNVVKQMLPPSLSLAAFKILEDDIVIKPKLLFNLYDVDSTFMKGTRLEILTLAKSKHGSVHFVILDCITNTLSWDPIKQVHMGFANFQIQYDAKNYRTDLSHYRDKLLLDSKKVGRRKISKRFAVDANHVCFYRNCDQGYPMRFDVNEVMQDVTRLSVHNIENTFWTNCRGKLTHAFVHNYDMNFQVI